MLFTRKIVVVRPDFMKEMSPRYHWLARSGIPVHPERVCHPFYPAFGGRSKGRRVPVFSDGRPLVVHFGFAAVHKGIDRIFEIADPERDHIVLACDLSDSDPYQRTVRELADSPPWRGR